MAKVKVKTKIKKVKKKFDVTILAPKFLNEEILGKGKFSDLTKLIGRKIKINMMYLTNKKKNQNIKLSFKINEVKSDKANTKISGYEQVPYYLTRYLKKQADLVEDVINLNSKDNKIVILKTFIITKNKVSFQTKKNLRKDLKENILKIAKEQNSEDILKDIIDLKLQSLIRPSASKITPIKSIEFRKVEIK